MHRLRRSLLFYLFRSWGVGLDRGIRRPTATCSAPHSSRWGRRHAPQLKHIDRTVVPHRRVPANRGYEIVQRVRRRESCSRANLSLFEANISSGYLAVDNGPPYHRPTALLLERWFAAALALVCLRRYKPCHPPSWRRAPDR